MQRSNVTGKVKGKFQPHFDLLMTVGEGMIREQFLEYFSMENIESEPQNPDLVNLIHQPRDQQKSILLSIVQMFMKNMATEWLKCPI